MFPRLLSAGELNEPPEPSPPHFCSPDERRRIRLKLWKRMYYMYYMLTVRLPDDINARLERLASETGRPKSFYVREALQEYLEDLEDIYIAEKRLEELRAGRSHTVPLDEVLREHGLER